MYKKGDEKKKLCIIFNWKNSPFEGIRMIISFLWRTT